MLKRNLYLLMVCCLPLPAAETVIELDPARTTVGFTLADVLHTVHGSFRLKRGTVMFDPATGLASGEIVVDAASGQSGNGGRDHRMHKEILESARFPEAIFTPSRVTGRLAQEGESRIEVQGTFQIHGSSHEMTLQFRAQAKGSEIAASTSFVIPYVQWGIKNPSNLLLRVSDKLEMSVQATGRVR